MLPSRLCGLSIAVYGIDDQVRDNVHGRTRLANPVPVVDHPDDVSVVGFKHPW